ncbi:MAG: FlgD immunoglobulin-like domain containing protein [Bacteroidota bacterium]
MVDSLTAQMNPPLLLSPVNAAMGQPVVSIVNWHSVAGALSYQIQLSTTLNFSPLIINDSSITDTAQQVGPLLNDFIYYWRVRAINATQISSWSAIWFFKTVVSPPAQPQLISPANNSNAISTHPWLNWMPAYGSALYHLQISKDTSFAIPVYDNAALAVDSQQVSSLMNNTAYYWRVNATNSGGTSAWSATWKFTTIVAIPPVPTLLNPLNGSINQPASINLQWSDGDNTAYYRLQVDTTSAFSAPRDFNGILSQSFSINNLDLGKTYYWRVAAINPGGTSPWSIVWSFTTEIENSNAPPPVPILIDPVNGSADLSLNIILHWVDGDTNSVYRLQVAMDSAFTLPLLDSTGIILRSAQLNNLTAGTKYYWRLNATNGGGSSTWSMIWYFSTKLIPPAVPVLLNPPSGAPSESTTVSLIWSASTNAATYTLQVASDAGFNILIYSDSTITTTTKIIQSLAYNATYYWRVNAKNAAGYSGWSNSRSFTTRTASGLQQGPTLVSPGDGAINQPVTLTLQWNSVSGSTNYELQLALVPDFSVTTYDNATIVGTSQVVGGQRNDTIYYWRVRAYNLSVPTDWSSSWSFKTMPVPPSVPVLQSPANGSINQQPMLHLLWSGVSTSSVYQVQLSTSLTFNTKLIDSSIVGLDTLSIGLLTFNSTYYWHVRASNVAGSSNYSDVWSFTVVGGIAPAAKTFAPQNIGLYSVTFLASVNPNGDSTRVAFQWGTNTSYEKGSIDAIPSLVLPNVQAPDTVYDNLLGLSPITTYHYRVVATNKYGAVYGNDQTFTTTYPTSPYRVTTSQIFPAYASPSEYSSTDYRLIGLPGASNASVNNFIPGYQNVDWQIYWDNGAASNGIVAYDGSPNFKCTAGKAFWVLYRDTLSIDTTLTPAPLDLAQNINIALHSGWNLITNPYPSTIPWSSVQIANHDTSEPIWSFNGTFAKDTTFRPFAGYYYFNTDSSRHLLKIPDSLYFTQQQSRQFIPPVDWGVNIGVSTGQQFDRTAWIGVSSRIIRKGDKINYHKPAGLSSLPRIVFSRPDWDAVYSSYATDIRPEFTKLEKWDFDVFSKTNRSTHLDFSGTDKIPSKFNVFLIQQSRSKYIDLRNDTGYNFVPDVEKSRFSIIVGSESDTRAYLNSIAVPRAIALLQNYPNPFNPTTSFQVEVPSRTRISLKIFNILGQEVSTVYNGDVDAGWYTFKWNGQDENAQTLPSGVYFSRLESSISRPIIRKMLMIK